MTFDLAEIGAPFRMQPGLRRVAATARQLTPSHWGDAALREKLGVLERAADAALLVAPGVDAAALWRRIGRRAAEDCPAAFRVDDEDGFAAPSLGWSLRGPDVCGDGPPEIGACLRALPCAQRLAGLVALAFVEDMALLDGTTGRVPALAVCLPSRWSPAEKIGRHFTEIHVPVADGAALIAAAEPLVRLVVTAGPRWERFVWTLTPSPRLDAHPQRAGAAAWDASASPEALLETAFLRTEHQMFSAFAAQSQALFTIRVDVTPLDAALRHAADAERLRAALASMTPAVLAYRGLTPARDRLLQGLASRAGA